MRRPLIAAAIAVATLAGSAVLAVSGGVAQAHHTDIECVGDAVWSLTNSEGFAEIATVVETGEVITILPNATVTVTYDGTSLTVNGYWPKGPGVEDDAYNTSTGTGDCTSTPPTEPPVETSEPPTETEPPVETTEPPVDTDPEPTVPSTITNPPTSTTSPCVPLPGEPRDGDGDGLVLDGTAGERPIRTTCDPVNPPVTTTPPVVTDPPEAPSPTDPEVTEFRLPATR